MPGNNRRKIEGYIWNEEVLKAINANSEARAAAAKILELVKSGQASPLIRAYVADLALALGVELEALRELEQISGNAKGRDR